MLFISSCFHYNSRKFNSCAPPLSRYYLNIYHFLFITSCFHYNSRKFNSCADDAFSSYSPFSSPPPQQQSRSSPKLITIHGIDEIEKWSSSAVLLFIQAKILNDLFVLKLRCVPPQAKAISIAEAVHWKRSINLKVLSELKLSGLHHPQIPLSSPLLLLLLR